MKLVGHETRVGKRASREALVRVAHVERDEADVLGALDVSERGLELVDGPAVDELEETSAADVDDHRDEVARAEGFSAAEGVLVETDDRGPVRASLAVLEVEMTIERRVEPTGRAAQIATYTRQVDVLLACAELVFSIVDSMLSGGSGQADWQNVKCLFEDFRTAVLGFLDGLRVELRRQAPVLWERWWPANAVVRVAPTPS